MRKTTHQRRAKAGFKLVKFTAIDNASDDFADIKGLTGVSWDDTVQFFGVVFGWTRGFLRGSVVDGWFLLV